MRSLIVVSCLVAHLTPSLMRSGARERLQPLPGARKLSTRLVGSRQDLTLALMPIASWGVLLHPGHTGPRLESGSRADPLPSRVATNPVANRLFAPVAQPQLASTNLVTNAPLLGTKRGVPRCHNTATSRRSANTA
jgi:hypothetical protein